MNSPHNVRAAQGEFFPSLTTNAANLLLCETGSASILSIPF
jgi:hypothetical protein